MNPFKCNDSLHSYTYPVIKVVVCIAIILLDMAVRFHLHSSSHVLDIIIGTVSASVLLACVFCIYISWGEMISVSENRAKAKPISEAEMASGKWFSSDEIAALAQNCHSIAFEIPVGRARNRRFEIGSKSELKPGTSHFFNKCYYIGEKDYSDISEFKAALEPYQTDTKGIFVVKIDGGKPM